MIDVQEAVKSAMGKLQASYIVLGAFLALIGGIITQLFQNWLYQKREDQKLLHDARDILNKLEPDLEDFQPARSPLLLEKSDELRSIAIKLHAIRNRGLAKNLYEFADKDDKKTRGNLISIKTKLIKKLSKTVYNYERKKSSFLGKHYRVLRKMIKKERKNKEKMEE